MQIALTNYVKSWIRRLSEPRAEFNNQPACPFSSRALFAVVVLPDTRHLAGLLRSIRLDPWHVLIVRLDSSDAEEIRKILREQKAFLAERDLLALPSDPSRPMVVGGYRTTQYEKFFLIVQRKSELEKASLELRKRGYYQNWSEEQLRWLEDRE